mmetsp:Transcript_15049/g.17413  ORF Transcript_15049/g.17413 Transcript_15049/m.17413 type:complete len:225 (-) Transcript_15049:244-918(-)
MNRNKIQRNKLDKVAHQPNNQSQNVLVRCKTRGSQVYDPLKFYHENAVQIEKMPTKSSELLDKIISSQEEIMQYRRTRKPSEMTGDEYSCDSLPPQGYTKSNWMQNPSKWTQNYIATFNHQMRYKNMISKITAEAFEKNLLAGFNLREKDSTESRMDLMSSPRFCQESENKTDSNGDIGSFMSSMDKPCICDKSGATGSSYTTPEKRYGQTKFNRKSKKIHSQE